MTRWTVGVLCLLLCSPARADDRVARAKTHFALGARAYEANEFRVAIDAFEAANRLAPHPALLFSIAQASRKQYFIDRKPDDLRRAVASYKKYIAAAPDGGRRGEAGAALAELEPLAERLGPPAAKATEVEPASRKTARVIMGASVKTAVASIDGGPPLRLPGSAELSPGKHVIRAHAPGYFDVEREVEAVLGDPVAVDLLMRERPARIDLRTEDGAQVFVDGRLMGVTPLARPLEVPAGRRFVAVTKTGRSSYATEVELRRAEASRVDAPLRSTVQRKISYVLMGTGAAGLCAGVVFAALGAHQQTIALDIDELRKTQNIDDTQAREHADALAARSDFQRAAAGAFAGGTVLGAAGLLLYLFDASTPTAPPRPPDSRPTGPAGDQPETPSIFISSGPTPFGAAVGARF